MSGIHFVMKERLVQKFKKAKVIYIEKVVTFEIAKLDDRKNIG